MIHFKKNIYRSRENDIIVFDPFDYMVVNFTYTSPADGADLDLMVYYEGTGTIWDLDAVGYNQTPNAIKIPTDATPDANAYLWWANDDVSSPGVEAVVLGVKSFVDNVPVVGDTLNITLRAGWFNARGTGNVAVNLKTYLGGTMSKVGTDIINTGGVLVNNESKTINVLTTPGHVSIGHSDLLGTVLYNKVTKTASLV